MAGFPGPDIVARSYHLAKTGNYAGVTEVRRQLLAEGYEQSEIEAYFSNPGLVRTVVELCRHAQGRPRPT